MPILVEAITFYNPGCNSGRLDDYVPGIRYLGHLWRCGQDLPWQQKNYSLKSHIIHVVG